MVFQFRRALQNDTSDSLYIIFLTLHLKILLPAGGGKKKKKEKKERDIKFHFRNSCVSAASEAHITL